MIIREIPYRYAKALFTLSSPEKKQTALEKLVAFFKKAPNLREFLLNPQLSEEEKEKFLKKNIPFLHDQELLNFLFLLIRNKRLKYLPQIANEFRKMIGQSLGIVLAKIISSEPIESSITEQLKKKLQSAYKKKIILEEIVDPKLIGGAILIVGNKIIDNSIKGRLDSFKNYLMGV